MKRGESRRSNPERTEATKAALLKAARDLFVENGYAATSTPEIVKAAGITRGALYHHFEDKRALFLAVVEQEAREVAAMIERATPPGMEPHQALLAGAQAYLSTMAVRGRTRLLLIEGPAVLTGETVEALDRANAARTLREGLAAAVPDSSLPLDAMAMLLSAAFDRAALAIEAGADAAIYGDAMRLLVERVIGPAPQGPKKSRAASAAC